MDEELDEAVPGVDEDTEEEGVDPADEEISEEELI